MAKGNATKATKVTTKASKAKPQGKPAKKAGKIMITKSAARAPAAEKSSAKAVDKPVAVAPSAQSSAGVVGLKKKNVKRGAPPMLPRRMVRRPDPVALGSPGAPPPGPPRLLAQPGSLHAPARAPEGAESLKQRLGQVMGLISQLRALKRTLNRQFFEGGLILQKLSEPALFQAKGYGSFEKFVEREIERELAIGRGLAHDLVSIVRLFHRAPAEELGLDKLRGALRALWPEPGPSSSDAGSSE